MRILAASIASLLLGLLAVASYAGPVEQFEQGYKDGTLFPGDRGYDNVRVHSTERELQLTRIVESDDRIKAHYSLSLLWDGQPRRQRGVIELFLKDGVVIGEQHLRIDDDRMAAFDMAVAGQAADVGSTAAALSAGLEEGNPLGFAVLPAKIGALMYSKTLPLHDCIKGRQMLGTAGWTFAGWNLGLLALGPAAGVVGALAGGFGSSQRVKDDAPFGCVEA